jgi:AraC-like DNA-binding protein
MKDSTPRQTSSKEDQILHLKRLLDRGYSLEEIANKTGQSLKYLERLLEDK